MGAAKKLIDRKVLRDLVPINALSAVHIEEISKKAVIEEIRSGRYVFKTGDRDNQSIYLLEGKVELMGKGRDVVDTVVAGTETARHPLAHKQPRQLSARAAGKVVVARLDSSLLDVLLTWDESSGYDVVEIDAQDDDDWMTRMLQSQAFMQLPPSNIHQLLMRLESITADPGDKIVNQGDDGDFFYIVKSGRLAVTRKASARSSEVLLAELGEGACFGEEALVSGTKRNASVTMITPGTLMRLSKDDFNELLCAPLVHEVKFAEAQKLVEGGAQWLDVRLPGEFENQAIKGSANVPLSALRDQADELLDKNTEYVVCCDTGRRSAAGAFVLSQRGFNVYVLRNGLMDVADDEQVGASAATEDGREAEVIPFSAESSSAAGEGEEGGAGPKVDTAAQKTTDDAAKERESLRRQLQDLKQQLESARKELQQAAERATSEHNDSSKDKKQLVVLEKSIQQEQKLRAELESRAKQAQESAQSLQSAVDKLRSQLQAREQELEEKSRAVHKLESGLKADLSSAQLELENSQRRVESTERGKQQLQDELNRLQQTLAQIQESAEGRGDALRNELEQMAKRLEREQQEHRNRSGELQQNLRQVREDYQQLGQRASALAGERDAARRDAAKLQQSVESLQEQLQTARQDATQAQDRHGQLQGVLSERDQQLADLKQDLQQAGSHEQELKNQLEAAERKAQDGLAQAGQQSEQLSGELEKARHEIGELQRELEASRKQQASGRQQASELENRLTGLKKEYDSEIAGVRDALTRAQNERENIKRDSASLLERLRSAERDLENERADHEASMLRLRKEIEASAGESAAGLASELEVLQEQLKQGASEREDLETRLGERSKQIESLQQEREKLAQQLQQAQDSAREAEQQLVEANQTASEEMQIRLQAEQQAQQALREEIGKATAEREEACGQLAVRDQEIEELREALQEAQRQQTDAQVVEKLQEAERTLSESLRRAEQERDALQEAEQQARQEADQLRAEAEVARGLVEMQEPSAESNDELADELDRTKRTLEQEIHSRSEAEQQVAGLQREVGRLSGDLDTLRETERLARQEADQLRAEAQEASRLVGIQEPAAENAAALADELDQTKQNLELAISLRSEAEQQAAGLQEEVERLSSELDALRADDSSEAQFPPAPSPDDSRPRAATAMRMDIPAEDVSRGGGWKGMLLGLVLGGAAASAAFWWLNTQSTSGIGGVVDSSPARPPLEQTREQAVAQMESEQSSPARRDAGVVAKPEPATKAGKKSEKAVPAPKTPAQQPVGSFRDSLSHGGKGPTMVELHKDRFEMGSGSTSQNFDERPRHTVNLKRFAISKQEVTFAQYDRFAKATGRSLPHDAGWGRASRPVINVSWNDAVAYTRWLSTQTGHSYRLPSEAEWEFAARAGSLKRYAWGSKAGDSHANCFDCGGKWAGRQTAPVASFEASAYGLHDLSGNAREWVQDCYTPSYKDAPSDGSAVEAPACGERVIRGGSYNSPSDKLRTAARDRDTPAARVDDLGFRVVREF